MVLSTYGTTIIFINCIYTQRFVRILYFWQTMLFTTFGDIAQKKQFSTKTTSFLDFHGFPSMKGLFYSRCCKTIYFHWKLVIPVNMLTHVNSIGFNLFYVSLPGCSPRMRFITNSGEPLNTDGCVCCRHSSIHTSIQSSIHQSPPECQSLDSAGW